MKDISKARLQLIREQQAFKAGIKKGRAEMAFIFLPLVALALISVIVSI